MSSESDLPLSSVGEALDLPSSADALYAGIQTLAKDLRAVKEQEDAQLAARREERSELLTNSFNKLAGHIGSWREESASTEARNVQLKAQCDDLQDKLAASVVEIRTLREQLAAKPTESMHDAGTQPPKKANKSPARSRSRSRSGSRSRSRSGSGSRSGSSSRSRSGSRRRRGARKKRSDSSSASRGRKKSRRKRRSYSPRRKKRSPHKKRRKRDSSDEVSTK